jgi:SAM-dependent methyltransferase
VSIHPWAQEGFSRGAYAYERARPAYPTAAVSHLVDRLGLRPGATVVDLAAGTGKLARLLVRSGAHVVAVEPVRAMRELIPGDGIDVLTGTADAIPLPAAAADAVVVAQAFQWFRADAALAEIHRVLRPKGRLAIVRNRRDLDDPVQREFDEILDRHRSHPSLEAKLDVESAVHDTGFFQAGELSSFPNEYELDSEDLVTLAGSETSISLLEDGAREGALADFRRLAEVLPPRLRLRYTTEIYVAERVGDGKGCRR